MIGVERRDGWKPNRQTRQHKIIAELVKQTSGRRWICIIGGLGIGRGGHRRGPHTTKPRPPVSLSGRFFFERLQPYAPGPEVVLLDFKDHLIGVSSDDYA